MIDLHQHTILSDGTDSVEELFERNIETGIKVMAITDHDNIESVELAKKLAKQIGIKYITGVEFSTDFHGNSIHILCYGYNLEDKIIKKLIEKSVELRHKRVEFRLKNLEKEFGIKLEKSVIEKINNHPNPNKPMIANILKDLGYGQEIGDIIKKYLYHKMPDYKLKTTEVLKDLAKSSGISVYAHALGGVGEKRVPKEVFEERLKSFISAGLKGLECYYSLYSKEEQDYLVETAKNNNLFISGGSDYHGKNKTVKIGELSNFGGFPQKEEVTILKVLL